MLVSPRCPTCTAPLTFAPGARVTTCPYCRTEVRDVGAPASGSTSASSGVVLGETIAIRTPGGVTIPLLEPGAPLPATKEETLSTARDDQPSLRCELVTIGAAGTSPRSVAQLEIAVARAPRGVAKAPMVIRVDADGNAHAAVTTSHAMANAAFSVRVRS